MHVIRQHRVSENAQPRTLGILRESLCTPRVCTPLNFTASRFSTSFAAIRRE